MYKRQTTVKELTAAALSASGKTHKSVKSYNNHWGVPLTLARLPQDARFGVFEIGMNHAGEISRLSPQVRPHVAAITTVAPVHIEHFGSLEAIADAKAEIFLGVEHGGSVLIPADNPMTSRLLARAKDIDGIKALTFGKADNADAHIIDAVSYTHLDVYKRQVSRNFWRGIDYGCYKWRNHCCRFKPNIKPK